MALYMVLHFVSRDIFIIRKHMIAEFPSAIEKSSKKNEH